MHVSYCHTCVPETPLLLADVREKLGATNLRQVTMLTLSPDLGLTPGPAPAGEVSLPKRSGYSSPSSPGYGPSVSSLLSLCSTVRSAVPYTRSELPFGFAALTLAEAL